MKLFKLAILCGGIALFGGFSWIQVALGNESSQIIIKFNVLGMDSTPIIKEGTVSISASGQGKSISAFSNVARIRNIFPQDWTAYSILGPYVCDIVDVNDIQAYVQLLSENPDIAYASVNPVDGEVTSEYPVQWFPDQQQDQFCAEPQLHRRVVGDTQNPSDWCSEENAVAIGDQDMDLPQAWAISKGSPEVVVAVVDCGFAWAFPDLGGDGPPYQVSPEDSVYYFTNGVLYNNQDDPPGDDNSDGRPGLALVDDDNDGRIDEDSQGYDYRNVAESDVWQSEIGSVVGNTIYDPQANFAPNGLVGYRFYYNGRPDLPSIGILGNTANSFEAEPIDPNQPQLTWELYLTPGSVYRLGDGDDNNESIEESYPDSEFVIDDDIDDVGWQNDLLDDDDEIGVADDYHGYDFVGYNGPIVLTQPYPSEDYDEPDNNVFSNAAHGTWAALLVSSSVNHGHMLGVAPGVKLLLVRSGYAYPDVTDGWPQASVPNDIFVKSIGYCIEMKVDIIVTTIGDRPFNPEVKDILQLAVDQGIVWVNGAGNSHVSTLPSFAAVNPRLLVSGLDATGNAYVDPYGGTNFGEWVDISASYIGLGPHQTQFLPGSVDYVDHFGTSLSGPFVGGVVALVKSVYPWFSRDEVINKVKYSVDDIYSNGMNDGYVGLLGEGRVNAYKALTFYGTIPASVPDTTWAHNIWIGGDIDVPAGTSLAISGGDTVRVAVDDLLSAGNDPNEIEFRIEGVLDVQGSPATPVVFELFNGSQMTWEYDSVVSVSGETFNVGGLGIAAVASAAHSPLVPNTGTVSQVFSVEIDGVSAGETVDADLAGLGLAGTTLPLLDDGLGEDIVASDGIFTSAAFSASLAGGISYIVDVTVHAQDGGYTQKGVSVEVPEVMAKVLDVSSSTSLVYPGIPYSSVPCDLDSQKESDLVVAVNAGSYSVSHVFDQVLPSGSPIFLQPDPLEGFGARGVSSVDYDNDGDEDLFLAHVANPKLYRNNSGSYEDITNVIGLSSLAAGSTLGCWADYDNDGWLDLFVARSEPAPGGPEPPDFHNINYTQHRLFHNETGLGGGFVDVTSTAGISVDTNGSVAASWGDLDGDGDMDLIVLNLCDPPLGQTLLFVNQGNGTFTEEGVTRLERSLFSGEPILFGTGVVWADMDNDGDLDLVFSSAVNGSSVWLNNGAGVFPIDKRMILPVLGGSFSGLSVFDHDLDGWQDIMLITRDSGTPSRLLLGRPSGNGITFVENTHNATLAQSSAAMGSVTADFTGDGDCDFYIGRPTADGEYFYITKDQVDQDSLGQRYVKVRLESPANDTVNRQGIGAVVEVTADNLVQTQIVDGGSGRGGQKDRTLIFGLGDYSSDIVTATVHWQGGIIHSDVALIVSGGASGEVVNVISDVPPVLSDVKAEMVIDPGTGDIDWKFSWNTVAATTNTGDTVYIDQVGITSPCLPGWTTVVPGGVPYSYTFDSSSGYEHVLIIPNWDCESPCSFRFSVESDNGLDSTQSPQVTKKVLICPVQF